MRQSGLLIAAAAVAFACVYTYPGNRSGEISTSSSLDMESPPSSSSWTSNDDDDDDDEVKISSLLWHALDKPSSKITLHPDDLHSITQVSKTLRLKLQSFLESKPLVIWKDLLNICGTDVLAQPTDSSLSRLDYFVESRELHLQLDKIIELPLQDFIKCIDLTLTIEKSVLVENIWYHISSVDIDSIIMHQNTALLFSIWKKTKPHYYIFDFHKELWMKEINTNLLDVRWQSGKSLAMNDGPIAKFLKSFEYLGQVAENAWAAFSIPDMENFDHKEWEVTTGIRLIWAIPYSKWDMMIPVLIQRPIDLFLPLSLAKNPNKSYSFIKHIERYHIKPAAALQFGSNYLNSAKPLFLDIIKRMAMTIAGYGKWPMVNSLTVGFPMSAFGFVKHRYQNGLEIFAPNMQLLNEIMGCFTVSMLKERRIEDTANMFNFQFQSQSISPLNSMRVLAGPKSVNDAFRLRID